MKYNTERNKLVIPEYGRNLQQMAEFACDIENREERNMAANTIINLMSIMNPHFREEEDYKHKLWDHLHIITNFRLDVDSPYPKPNPDEIKPVPKKLNYPTRKMKYAHYGNILEALINIGKEMEDGPEKNRLTEMVANMMKRAYLNYNRDSVNDDMIKEQLLKLSDGKMQLPENYRLISTHEVISTIRPNQPNQQSKSKKKKNKGSNQNNQNNQNRNNPQHNNRNNQPNNFKKNNYQN